MKRGGRESGSGQTTAEGHERGGESQAAANPAALCQECGMPLQHSKKLCDKVRALETELADLRDAMAMSIDIVNVLRLRAETAEARWAEHDVVCPSKELVARAEKAEAEVKRLKADIAYCGPGHLGRPIDEAPDERTEDD